MSGWTLWEALKAQADAWAGTSVVTDFARELPRNAAQRSEGLPGVLQKLQAAVGFIGWYPLRLSSNLLPALSVTPGLDSQEFIREHGGWLQAASRVESAHRVTVAWMRSRLPGYPNLLAPQLVPGTPFTTNELTSRMIWTPGERAQGLQFRNPPLEVASTLDAEATQRREIDRTVRAVVAALEKSPEWVRLGNARSDLGDVDRMGLQEAKERLRERLSSARVDEYEPHLAVRRADFRSVVLEEIVGGLSGAAAEYANAFDAAVSLIESAASDVFGQLMLYGLETFVPADLEVQPGEPSVAAFSVADATWPEVGMLAWLEDPLVVDAVSITGVTYNWDPTNIQIKVTARLLRGSSVAWR